MDTLSHFVIGFGLGGLAHLSPQVASNPELGLAVTIGTIIASEAPDFDYIYRLKGGNELYLKKHRGVTHSVPAWFGWPTLITLGMVPFFHGLPWLTIWLWCFAAVLIHVGLDALNTFGTQALMPFTKKRLSKDVLAILDPYLFLSQTLGIILWMAGKAEPGPLFAWIDGLSMLYIVVRLGIHQWLKIDLTRRYRSEGVIGVNVAPTFRFNRWTAVIETEAGFVLGRFNGGRFKEEKRLEKPPAHKTPICSTDELMRKSRVADTFFSTARHIHLETEELEKNVRYIWTDLRYRFGEFFPYKAVIELDSDGNIVSEHLGWRGNRKMTRQRQFTAGTEGVAR